MSSAYRPEYFVVDRKHRDQITVHFLSDNILALIDREAMRRNMARSSLLRKILLKVFKDRHLLDMLAGEK